MSFKSFRFWRFSCRWRALVLRQANWGRCVCGTATFYSGKSVICENGFEGLIWSHGDVTELSPLSNKVMGWMDTNLEVLSVVYQW